MPWKETSMLHQRLDFIQAIQEQHLSVAAACRAFGISRPTGYKFLARYQEQGESGLLDLSRAPKHCPHELTPEVQQRIIALRAQYPSWGPKKLRAWLQKHHPEQTWPALSTISELLTRSQLIVAKQRRPHRSYVATTLTPAQSPNHVWCVDFKGEFATTDGKLCYPLTLTDRATRFLLRCHALPSTHGHLAQPVFAAAFQEYGLPQIIRSDNGTPFASTALTGLSRLSLWWLKLGIVPERITPGCPYQNGTHERMHRTLKAEATRPAARNLRAQQECFTAFRQLYNQERPHEALGQVTPASLYTPSPRPYPPKLPVFEYSSFLQTRTVRPNGTLRWQAEEIFLSEVLSGETIGLDRIEERRLAIYIGALPLAILDEAQSCLLPPKQAKPYLEKLRQESQPERSNV
jgi:transposase InsO family protein